MIFNKNNLVDNMSEVTASSGVLRKNNIDKIYRTYNFAYRPKLDLPIFSIKNRIVSMIASNSVVIIRGSTGCGKTTQLPQLILNDEFERKRHCNIIGKFLLSNLNSYITLILQAFSTEIKKVY